MNAAWGRVASEIPLAFHFGDASQYTQVLSRSQLLSKVGSNFNGSRSDGPCLFGGPHRGLSLEKKDTCVTGRSIRARPVCAYCIHDTRLDICGRQVRRIYTPSPPPQSFFWQRSGGLPTKRPLATVAINVNLMRAPKDQPFDFRNANYVNETLKRWWVGTTPGSPTSQLGASLSRCKALSVSTCSCSIATNVYSLTSRRNASGVGR
jgi:hypothetical protein